MQDKILEINDLVNERPRTKSELLQRTEISKSVLDKKINALFKLGKVKMIDSSWGERIVHKKFSAPQEEIEEEIPGSWRRI